MKLEPLLARRRLGLVFRTRPILSGGVIAALAGFGLGAWLQPQLAPELRRGAAPTVARPLRDRVMFTAAQQPATFEAATESQSLSGAAREAPAVGDSPLPEQAAQSSNAFEPARTRQPYAEGQASLRDWSRADEDAPPVSGPERDFFMPGLARSDPPRWRESPDEGYDVDEDEAPPYRD